MNKNDDVFTIFETIQEQISIKVKEIKWKVTHVHLK